MKKYYAIHLSNIYGFVAVEPEVVFDTYEEAVKDISKRMLDKYKRYKKENPNMDKAELQNIVNNSFVIKTNDKELKE